MILEPVLPVAVLVILTVALVGFSIWQLTVAKTRRLRLSWVLRVVMVALLLLVALRPVIPSTSSGPTAAGGLEVYIVVDTTSSVSAKTGATLSRASTG